MQTNHLKFSSFQVRSIAMNFLPANNKKIDKTDHEILSILHKEARISMTELGNAFT